MIFFYKNNKICQHYFHSREVSHLAVACDLTLRCSYTMYYTFSKNKKIWQRSHYVHDLTLRCSYIIFIVKIQNMSNLFSLQRVRFDRDLTLRCSYIIFFVKIKNMSKLFSLQRGHLSWLLLYVSLTAICGQVWLIQLYVKFCHLVMIGQWFSPRTPAHTNNIIDHH